MHRVSSFQENKGVLYVVATPIGNLKEFTLRAQEVILECDYVASEDTRTTGLLLNSFNIKKPMISCHEHNEVQSSEHIINLLKEGKKIALTSDAGYPSISDPGEKLINKAIENNIPVSIVHGSSALLGGLIGSSLDKHKFYFHGFLNAKKSLRRDELEELINYPMTLIFYESPHRIKDTLLDLYEVLGDRHITIARELTKIHEEYIYGTLKEMLSLDETTLKGEMVLVIEGNKKEKKISQDELVNIISQRLKEENVSKKDLAKEISSVYGLRKNEVYELILKLTK